MRSSPSCTSTRNRFAAMAVLAVAAVGMASIAHARGDITWSIGISSPGVYLQPASVYVQPRTLYVHPGPVYLPPQPVYVQPRILYVQPAAVYLQPAPVYLQPAPIYVQPQAYGYSYYNGPGWRRAEWERRQHWRHHNHHGRGWDRDGPRN